VAEAITDALVRVGISLEYSARKLRALEIALKLQDAFPAEKHRHEIKHHVDLEERLRRALDGGTSDQKTI
jgi:hypothetical protein